MKSLIIFGGSSHPELINSITDKLGVPPGRVILGNFSNKETSVQILESVRDLNVYIIQSGCGHVNDNLLELLIMINACKTASAAKVTAVIPCFPYARQPDAPYKRDGSPRRMLNRSLNATENGPTESEIQRTPQIQKQMDAEKERQMKKLEQFKLDEGHASFEPAQVFSEGSPQAQALFNVGSSHSSSSGHTSPKREPPSIYTIPLSEGSSSTAAVTLNTLGKVRATMISSPLQPHVTPLGLSKDGYKHWVARSGTLVANMIVAAGAQHIITMDLHDPQFQGFFEIPVDNLYGSPLMVKYIREKIPNYKSAVIVSPDAGGAKRASSIAQKLQISFAMVHKGRKKDPSQPLSPPFLEFGQENLNIHEGSSVQEASGNHNMMLVGNVRGKECILIDDIADTSHTITRAADLLHLNGAVKIYAVVTHGILSGDAALRIKESKIDELIVSNTVPQAEHEKILGRKLKVFDVAPIFAEAIRRIHNGESVSYLFEPVDI